MVAADTDEIVQPVADYLQSRGYTVSAAPGIQMIAANLPKEIILELAQRPDIGSITLQDYETNPIYETAIPSD